MQEDTHWNTHNGIYGDNPRYIGNKPVPNTNAMQQSLNLYVYVSNNPIKYWDPTGHWQVGDEKYGQKTQDAIAKATSDYYNAPAGKAGDAQRAAANAARANGTTSNSNVNDKGQYYTDTIKNSTLTDSKGNQYMTVTMWSYSTNTVRFVTEGQPASPAGAYKLALITQPDSWMNIMNIAGKKLDNGTLGPAAYTHLSKIMYDWYLAPEKNRKRIREDLLKEAQNFIKAGYKDTNNLQLTKDINFMPKLPSGNMTQEEHYFRNELNIEFEKSQLTTLNNLLPTTMQWGTVIADEHPKEHT